MSLSEGDGEQVSVIIPTYYRNDLLPETIESVYNQKYRPIELIVVDDSGEANAEPVVASYDEVTYVPMEENQGPQAARNIGLEQASGEYVQFLDDDDILREDKFSKQVPKMSDSIGVVYSGLEVYETGAVVHPKSEIKGNVLKYALLLRLYPCSNCTMLLDRSVLDELMPLSNRHAADDLGMQIELAQRTEFAYVDEPLIYVRDDVENSLGSTWENLDARMRLLKQYDHLYEQFPPNVKKKALSEIYRLRAEKHLEEQVWSPKAILTYGLSAYHAPDDQILRTVDFATAFLGKPGLKLANRIRRFSREFIVN